MIWLIMPRGLCFIKLPGGYGLAEFVLIGHQKISADVVRMVSRHCDFGEASNRWVYRMVIVGAQVLTPLSVPALEPSFHPPKLQLISLAILLNFTSNFLPTSAN